MQSTNSLIVISALALAGCASQPPPVAGKHLVYRDAAGAPTLQIDYPTEEFCRQVEAVASRNARCQPQSVGSQLKAQAKLRYNPPGMVVDGHYPDVEQCQRANSVMARGVELLNPCTAK